MTESKRTYVVREAVLKLLSSEEIARVSSAEAGSRLSEGDEYLNLEHLDQGVQRAQVVTTVPMGQVLPRSAVGAETWSKILAQLAS